MGAVTMQISAPNAKQRLFLSDTHRHVGYGGARGGGKSWAIRTKAKLLAMQWPGIRMLIVRKSYRELINNHVLPLQAEIPPEIARYNKSDKVFRFCNGSTIWLGYCANDSDLDQYQGAEYDVVFIDEATQLKEDWIRKINLAVRQPNGMPKRTYYTCNPGGVSHNYIKRLFIDKRYEAGEVPEAYSFVQALVTDNTALMEMQPGYKAELEALPPKLRKAWLEGCWDIFDGQFFEEFTDDPDHYVDRAHTHVIKPFDIPDGWKIYRSFDWGYAKPFSCGWWAVDYDGVLYRILELYGCTQTPNEGIKWTPQHVFAEIARAEREHPWLRGKHIIGIADPAIWDAETGESIADAASKAGVFFSPADNKRIPGWMQVHYRLHFDANGYPMMYVFDTCRAFIRTMPLLQYDEHKVEDLDTEGEDHVADEVRYMCMARPIKPRAAEEDDGYSKSPMAVALDIPKDDIMPRRIMQRMEIIEED